MVFVIDKHKKPLMPVTEKRARQLLGKNRAVIHRIFPFVIRLTDRSVSDSETEKLILKIDPGSKYTGFAIVRRDKDGIDYIIFMMQLKHRGNSIHLDLLKRSAVRHSRRSRNTWYRRRHWNGKEKGWIAPSLMHRVYTTETWVRLLLSWCPIGSIEFEYCNFDTQLMQDPDISGVEYQRGTLYGYEVRQYAYAKFGRKCVYCDKEADVIELDHVLARTRGGSDRVSNLVPCCHECNQAKDNRLIEDFLKDDPERLARILSLLKAPLKDAAAMNITRNRILEMLDATGLPVRCWSGARTKWNRDRFGIEKDHHLDAACVGDINGVAGNPETYVLMVKAAGHGTRKRRLVDKYGFPRGAVFPKHKFVHGFQTGDLCKAIVPAHLKTGGTHIGRIAVRTSGRFDISTKNGKKKGIGWQYFKVFQRKDGYNYGWKKETISAFLPSASKWASCGSEL